MSALPSFYFNELKFSFAFEGLIGPGVFSPLHHSRSRLDGGGAKLYIGKCLCLGIRPGIFDLEKGCLFGPPSFLVGIEP